MDHHVSVDLDVDSDPRVSVLELRKKLLLEEVAEVSEAIDILSVELLRGKKGTKEQWANFLKELADVQYIVYSCTRDIEFTFMRNCR